MDYANPHIERALKTLAFRPIFDHEGREIHVVCLMPWSPPLVAPWWRGKGASLIGADVDGNFFLRYCGGQVLYRHHQQNTCETVAASVRDFVSRLREDTAGTTEWWKHPDGPPTDLT